MHVGEIPVRATCADDWWHHLDAKGNANMLIGEPRAAATRSGIDMYLRMMSTSGGGGVVVGWRLIDASGHAGHHEQLVKP